MQVLSHACNLKSGLRRLKEETVTEFDANLGSSLSTCQIKNKKQKGKMKKRNKEREENS